MGQNIGLPEQKLIEQWRTTRKVLKAKFVIIIFLLLSYHCRYFFRRDKHSADYFVSFPPVTFLRIFHNNASFSRFSIMIALIFSLMLPFITHNSITHMISRLIVTMTIMWSMIFFLIYQLIVNLVQLLFILASIL